MQLMTLKEMADRIGSTEHRKPAKVLNQLRGAHQRGLLYPSDNKGPKAALRFSEREFFAARLLLVFIDLGIVAGRLDELNRFMRLSNHKTFTDGRSADWGLTEAIAAPLGWVFRARVRQSGDSEAVWGAFRPEGWAENSDDVAFYTDSDFLAADIIVPIGTIFARYAPSEA